MKKSIKMTSLAGQFFLYTIVVMLLMMVVIQPKNIPTMDKLSIDILFFAIMIAYTLVFYFVKRKRYVDINNKEVQLKIICVKPKISTLLKTLILGILVAVALILIWDIIANIKLYLSFSLNAVNDFKYITNAEFFQSCITIVIIAPIAEELLFRGLARATLRQASLVKTCVLTSLLFAISHFSLPSMPNAIIFGFLAMLIYIKTSSLLATMLFHAGFNFVTFIFTAKELFISNINFTLQILSKKKDLMIWIMMLTAIFVVFSLVSVVMFLYLDETNSAKKKVTQI